MKRVLAIVLLLACGICVANSDEFVPDFDAMKVLRCDIEETIFDQDEKELSKSFVFRIYSFEDEYKRMYLRREPVDTIYYYGLEKVEFASQIITDDYIEAEKVSINRENGVYTSTSQIVFDNPHFGIKTKKSVGVCKELN